MTMAASAVTPRTALTADLIAAELRELRALLDDALDGDFADEDWDHGLGGMHDDIGRLLAHGAVVTRRVRYRDRWLRVGYVEAVAVRSDARRSGLGGRVMAELERVIDRAYDAGMLSATDVGAALYAVRGWRVWGGRVCALGPQGIVRLSGEEEGLFVRPALAGRSTARQRRIQQRTTSRRRGRPRRSPAIHNRATPVPLSPVIRPAAPRHGHVQRRPDHDAADTATAATNAPPAPAPAPHTAWRGSSRPPSASPAATSPAVAASSTLSHAIVRHCKWLSVAVRSRRVISSCGRSRPGVIE